ncbi:MAG: extracellular solute-binding protein [Lachnospiraceae bacterium]|nr:extracellular solute-binding protein [Lachnospiraceae bacterium]
MQMKKLLALVLSVIMAFSIIACGSSTDSPQQGGTSSTQSGTASDSASSTDAQPDAVFDPMAKYDPAITVTTAISLDDEMQNYLGIKSDLLENNNWINAYRNELGIDVSIDWAVPNTQYEQKLNSTIIANDLPDIIAVNAQQLRLLVRNGMAADLTDVFEQYASPFTREMMEADGYMGLTEATIDGRLMAIPLVQGNVDDSNMLWIRKDWMDQLGKTAPKTIDELIELAEAFMEADLDGTGQAYGLGVTTGSWISFLGGGWGDLPGFFEGFGAYPHAWLDIDGKAAFGRIQPEMRDALAKLAGMYESGVIHREFATRDLTEDIAAGRVGIMYGQHWNSFWPLQMNIDNNPHADWLPFPIPTVDGSPGISMLGNSAWTFYVVNPDFANPEAVVKLYNFHYAVDCALSPDYDGDQFHIGGDRVQEQPESAFNWSIVKGFYPTQNLFIHRGLKAYFAGDESVREIGWINDAVTSTLEYEEDPIGNAVSWGGYRWSGPEGAFSVIDYYQTNKHTIYNLLNYSTDAMAEYNTTLDDMSITTFSRIIMGVDPIEEFDTFVADWWRLGGETITNEVNYELGR